MFIINLRLFFHTKFRHNAQTFIKEKKVKKPSLPAQNKGRDGFSAVNCAKYSLKLRRRPGIRSYNVIKYGAERRENIEIKSIFRHMDSSAKMRYHFAYKIAVYPFDDLRTAHFPEHKLRYAPEIVLIQAKLAA